MHCLLHYYALFYCETIVGCCFFSAYCLLYRCLFFIVLARGAPHIHSLIWVEGAPLLKEDLSNAEEVKDFVDQHITCHLPDPKDVTEAPLYNIVRKFQTHVHTSSCTRKKEGSGGKKSIGYCRFGFSRPSSQETTIEKRPSEVLRDRFLKKKAGRLYVLKRSLAEENINDYNPSILFAWRAK